MPDPWPSRSDCSHGLFRALADSNPARPWIPARTLIQKAAALVLRSSTVWGLTVNLSEVLPSKVLACRDLFSGPPLMCRCTCRHKRRCRRRDSFEADSSRVWLHSVQKRRGASHMRSPCCTEFQAPVRRSGEAARPPGSDAVGRRKGR